MALFRQVNGDRHQGSVETDGALIDRAPKPIDRLCPDERCSVIILFIAHWIRLAIFDLLVIPCGCKSVVRMDVDAAGHDASGYRVLASTDYDRVSVGRVAVADKSCDAFNHLISRVGGPNLECRRVNRDPYRTLAAAGDASKPGLYNLDQIRKQSSGVHHQLQSGWLGLFGRSTPQRFQQSRLSSREESMDSDHQRPNVFGAAFANYLKSNAHSGLPNPLAHHRRSQIPRRATALSADVSVLVTGIPAR